MEYNRAVSVKQRSSCKDVYRVRDNSKLWPLLNFHKLQTEEFSDFSLLSKNPLKRTKLFQSYFAEMGVTHLYTSELRKSM